MTRVRMEDFEQHEWNVGRNYLSVGSWEGSNRLYRESTYRHEHGLVEVYESLGRFSLTSLRFRYRGRDHIRNWPTTWGDKTLARLAREFVESVVAAQDPLDP